MLGFAHTVGEFGVILMIGGNIPGRTRVMSTAIFDYVETSQWREANILAVGMVVFAFAVILVDDPDREALRPGPRMSADGVDPRFVPRRARQVFARRELRRAGEGRDRAVRPVGLRQDDGAALHRGPATRSQDGVCEIDGEVWQDRDGTFLPTHKRPLGYVFQEASLFPHLSVRRNLLFGAPPRASEGGVAAPARAIAHARSPSTKSPICSA